jgi:hypothetical protein
MPTPVSMEVKMASRSRPVRRVQIDKNLHFDHDISFSKGGGSLTAANVRLLYAKHNLE